MEYGCIHFYDGKPLNILMIGTMQAANSQVHMQSTASDYTGTEDLSTFKALKRVGELSFQDGDRILEVPDVAFPYVQEAWDKLKADYNCE